MPFAPGPGEPRRSPTAASPQDRRRFLASLGLAAGAAFLAPLIRTRRGEARGAQRIEAGRRSLGTWMRVVVRHPDRGVAQRAIEDAFAAVNLVDAQMSVHRGDSQLAKVNASAGRAAVAVDPALRDVVAMACDAARQSGDAYDPTVLPLMKLYGFYGVERSSAPSAREVDRVLQRMGHERVRVDRAAGSVALLADGAGIDLGSIGKGWAVDRAVDAIRARGVTSALVDLGGNVYGLGVPEDDAEGWSVGVFHPVTAALSRVFVLRDAAVATSGNQEQSRVLDGVRVGHLFDARRGSPAAGHLSVSVTAPTAVASDVGSTTAFVLGPDRFRSWPGVLDSHFIG